VRGQGWLCSRARPSGELLACAAGSADTHAYAPAEKLGFPPPSPCCFSHASRYLPAWVNSYPPPRRSLRCRLRDPTPSVRPEAPRGEAGPERGRGILQPDKTNSHTYVHLDGRPFIRQYVRMLDILDWSCSVAPNGGRSVYHPDGTAFSCDAVNGLAATRAQHRTLPPAVAAWLIYPVLLGHVGSDDLEEAPDAIVRKQLVRTR
jgi:hypothetical protein